MMIATHSLRLSASNSYKSDCCQHGMSDLNSDRDLGEENRHFVGHLNSNILYCHRSPRPVLPHRKSYLEIFILSRRSPLSCKTIVTHFQTLCVMVKREVEWVSLKISTIFIFWASNQSSEIWPLCPGCFKLVMLMLGPIPGRLALQLQT